MKTTEEYLQDKIDNLDRRVRERREADLSTGTQELEQSYLYEIQRKYWNGQKYEELKKKVKENPYITLDDIKRYLKV